KTLQRHPVLAKIDLGVLQKLGRQKLDDAKIEVLAAEVGVAARGLHVEDAAGELENGYVEGAAAEVEHGDAFALLVFEAIGERRRRGLVQDAAHRQPGDATCVFGG